MRILTIIAICLLIVTSAVGIQARGDRGSKDSGNSSASSRGSDRNSSSSSDRASSNSSSDRHSASSSSDSGKTSSAYRPGGSDAGTRSDGGSSSSNSGGASHSTYSSSRSTASPEPARVQSNTPTASDRPVYNAYNRGSITSSTTTDMKVRRNDAVPAYRPSVQSTQQNSATTSTGSRGSRDLYSAYRPKSDRTNDVVPTVNAGAQASHDYTAYQPANAGGLSSASDARRGDQFTSQNHSAYKPVDNSNHATVTDMPTTQYVRNQRLAQSRMDTNAGYKPAAGGDTSNRGDQFQNRSGYKPGADGNHSTVAPMPTTRSMRDRKLAQDRMAATSSYRPAVTKPHFTYSDHKAPKGYRPPTYREGHYYYSHPHYTRPCSFGFWSLDYYSGFSRRSMYFHYGLFPYIEVTRIIVDSYPTVIYVDQPIYTVYGVRYENSRYPGLDEALGDIRSAWISGRYDLIERHVRNSNDIAVLLDGRYDYSVAPDDYLAMTQDALGEMDSVSWVWDKVQPRRDGTITGFATHTYRSGDAVRKVYVSYTLQKVDGCYYIVEVGSTQVPWN